MKAFGMPQNQWLDVALARGTATLEEWTQDGTLIAPAQLAEAWRIGTEATEAAVERGDLFEVWVNKSRYIPAALIPLGLEQAARLCHALKGQPASEKLIFLLRPHGGLGGQTVVQALQTGTPLSRIDELAAALARD
jgi:hypothetical protein